MELLDSLSILVHTFSDMNASSGLASESNIIICWPVALLQEHVWVTWSSCDCLPSVVSFLDDTNWWIEFFNKHVTLLLKIPDFRSREREREVFYALLVHYPFISSPSPPTPFPSPSPLPLSLSSPSYSAYPERWSLNRDTRSSFVRKTGSNLLSSLTKLSLRIIALKP